MYFHISTGYGIRSKWRVKVKAEELIACCNERIAYHEDRLMFWEGETDAARTKLQSQGISTKRYEVTGGHRTEASLDQSLVNRLGECEGKVKSHRASHDEFHAYQAMFRFMGPDAEIECDVDDVLYFNIEKADTGREE